jgi:hypothetical protein
VPVPVVDVRAVRMLVLRTLVHVRVAVLAGNQGRVRMVVVTVVVPVRMLVIQRRVPVAMMMRLGRVKVDGDGEERARGDDDPGVVSVADRIGQRGSHERRQREERPCSGGPKKPLRAEVEAETETIADHAASHEHRAGHRCRPCLPKRERNRRREHGAEDRFAEDHGARVEVGERSRKGAVERPTDGRAYDRREAERARSTSATAPYREEHGAPRHQRNGERHAPTAWFAVKRTGEKYREDRFEVEKQRCCKGTCVLQSPSEARRSQRRTQRGDQRNAPDLAPSERRLAGTTRRTSRADRSPGIEQGRGGERPDAEAEAFYERRRHSEKDSGDHGGHSAARDGVS